MQVSSGRVRIDPEQSQILSDPLDRFSEPFIKRVTRLPSPEFPGEGRTREKTPDLAGSGAHALRIGLDLDRFAELLADSLHQFSDRHVIPPTDIHNPA